MINIINIKQLLLVVFSFAVLLSCANEELEYKKNESLNLKDKILKTINMIDHTLETMNEVSSYNETIDSSFHKNIMSQLEFIETRLKKNLNLIDKVRGEKFLTIQNEINKSVNKARKLINDLETHSRN